MAQPLQFQDEGGPLRPDIARWRGLLRTLKHVVMN
jgi:hypothetical protein